MEIVAFIADNFHMVLLTLNRIFLKIFFIPISLMFTPTNAYSANRLDGKRLYKEKGCYTCHGVKGDGKGIVNLLEPATNFTEGFVYGDDLESIENSIKFGIRGKNMAPYDFLSDRELRALAEYIKKFDKSDKRSKKKTETSEE